MIRVRNRVMVEFWTCSSGD